MTGAAPMTLPELVAAGIEVRTDTGERILDTADQGRLWLVEYLPDATGWRTRTEHSWECSTCRHAADAHHGHHDECPQWAPRCGCSTCTDGD